MTPSEPGQRREPDEPDRERGQEQHVEEVVREPVDAHLQERGGPDREIARQGRWILEREDVKAGHGERVRERLTGQRAAERHPVADGPGDEHEHGDDPGNDDHAKGRSAGDLAPVEPEDHEDPGNSQPDRLVARPRREPDDDAQRKQSRIREAHATGIGREPRHQEAGTQRKDGEQRR